MRAVLRALRRAVSRRQAEPRRGWEVELRGRTVWSDALSRAAADLELDDADFYERVTRRRRRNDG